MLSELRQLYPNDRSGGGTLALLASLYRQTGDVEKEAEALSTLANLNDRALEAYDRLIELASLKQDWPTVYENASRYLAVQPMIPFGHEQLAKSAEELDKPADLATSLTALLEMKPVDPAAVHFRISQAHDQSGDAKQAKRHVLMALEYAPRYREAQQMLLKLAAGTQDETVAAGGQDE